MAAQLPDAGLGLDVLLGLNVISEV